MQSAATVPFTLALIFSVLSLFFTYQIGHWTYQDGSPFAPFFLYVFSFVRFGLLLLGAFALARSGLLGGQPAARDLYTLALVAAAFVVELLALGVNFGFLGIASEPGFTRVFIGAMAFLVPVAFIAAGLAASNGGRNPVLALGAAIVFAIAAGGGTIAYSNKAEAQRTEEGQQRWAEVERIRAAYLSLPPGATVEQRVPFLAQETYDELRRSILADIKAAPDSRAQLLRLLPGDHRTHALAALTAEVPQMSVEERGECWRAVAAFSTAMTTQIRQGAKPSAFELKTVDDALTALLAARKPEDPAHRTETEAIQEFYWTATERKVIDSQPFGLAAYRSELRAR